MTNNIPQEGMKITYPQGKGVQNLQVNKKFDPYGVCQISCQNSF